MEGRRPSFRSRVSRVVAALCAAAIGAACSPKEAPGAATQGGAPTGLAPCFADDGPVAFEVDGVPVPEKAVVRIAAFLRAADPSLTAERAKEVAVRGVAIPAAASYAAGLARREDGGDGPTAVALRRAAAWRDALAKGADFAALAAAESDDVGSKAAGGAVGFVTRAQMTEQATAGDAAFALPVGGTSGLVCSAYGVHVLRVAEAADGASSQQDRRRVSHLLAAFDPATLAADAAEARRRLMERAREARVKVLIDAYKKIVPFEARR